MAIKLGEAAGHYDFVNWSDNRWQVDYEEKIIAFIGYSDFFGQLNIGWPGEQPNLPQPKNPVSGDELWEEV